MCIAYQRAGIPGQRSQRGLRLTQRGGATTYFKASLVREPSLVGIEAFSPPTEAWASLEDSMVGRDARSQGREGGAMPTQTATHEGIRRSAVLKALA